MDDQMKQWLIVFLSYCVVMTSWAESAFPLAPPDTSTPKATYESYLKRVTEANLALGEVYGDIANVSVEQKQNIFALFDKASQTFDLSAISDLNRHRVAMESVMLMKEVLDRIPSFDPAMIPDSKDVQSWTIPNTNIQIVKQESGNYLFARQTVANLHYYYSLVKHLPSKLESTPDYYQYYSLSAGRLIPPTWFSLIDSLPPSMMSEIADQAVWQWVAFLLLTALLTGYAYLVYRQVHHALLKPSLMALGLFGYTWIADYQLNLTGGLMNLLNVAGELLFWPLIAQVAYIVASSSCKVLFAGNGQVSGLKKSLSQITGTIVGTLCGVAILGFGLHRLGVPVYGIVTGLSLGGMAIALAIKPTMENLIGGVILFMDKSLSVGDFCKVGSVSGVVEQIGVRSTLIRAKDRTQVTIANGDLVKMQIINFSRRDRYPLLVTLNLRYETPMETMVSLTRDIRSMLEAHELILASPLRVHFSSFSDYSLDIDVFAHIDTQEREAFLTIQQELLMKINQIVAEHEAKFALPSNTTYLKSDFQFNNPDQLKVAGDRD
ncbi:mechanosensitive ion channel family protein [Vibrio mediterranei]|nr:mechanosensitive ion channel family protein [Vibrio mediterranei]